MPKRCIKCNYVRNDEIDNDVPESECPMCGVIYAKAEAAIVAKTNEKPKQQKPVPLIKEWPGMDNHPENKIKKKAHFNVKKISLILLVFLVIGYIAASPLLTIMKIKTGIIENDSEILSENIEFQTLRQNLKEQLNANILINSKKNGLGKNVFSVLGVALASKMVDGLVDSFVTPTTLASIMRGNPPSVYKKKMHTKKADLNKSDLFKNARYRYDSMDKFSIWVPNKDGNEIRFILKRKGLSWKLVNFIFPT